jgi:hypothetical protein
VSAIFCVLSSVGGGLGMEVSSVQEVLPNVCKDLQFEELILDFNRPDGRAL